MEQVYVTETVQLNGGTVQQERLTVQTKFNPVYQLPGTTQAQKVEALKTWVASNRVYHQLELLGYIDDILAAPTSLGTVEVE